MPTRVCGLCHGFVICDVGLCFVVVVDARVCGGSLIAGGGGCSVVGGGGGSLGWV